MEREEGAPPLGYRHGGRHLSSCLSPFGLVLQGCAATNIEIINVTTTQEDENRGTDLIVADATTRGKLGPTSE